MLKKILSGLNIALLLIILFSFIVRVVGIGKYPVGFTQDEASFGYDAYSLLKTGKDQWGVSFPLVFRSFGDFKMPLYTYLTIPSVFIFGLNEFATRLPNAVFGVMAVLAVYLMVLEYSKDKKLALISSIFLASSPWHISISRGAFEANLTTFFIPFGIWCYLKGLRQSKWMIVAAISFGLNLFSYHSARIFTILIIPALIVSTYKGVSLQGVKSNIERYLVSIIVFTVFVVLMFYSFYIGAGKRGADILISNPTDNWAAVADRRYEAVLIGMPDIISKAFSNKLTYVTKTFVNNYLSYLSPNFFFTQGAGEATYGMISGRGVLYTFEIFFLLISLYSFIKGRHFKGIIFFLFWILVAPIPAALTKSTGYAANRVAIMMPSIQIVSAYGAIILVEYITKSIHNKSVKNISYISILFVLVISVITFFEDYIYHAPIQSAGSMSYGTREVVKYISSIEDKYEEIRVSRTLSVPQIWFAFYKHWDPKDYQKYSKDWIVYEQKGYSYIDQYDGYRLGKYIFGHLDMNTLIRSENILIVGKPSEFLPNISVQKSIYYPNGSPAYFIVAP